LMCGAWALAQSRGVEPLTRDT